MQKLLLGTPVCTHHSHVSPAEVEGVRMAALSPGLEECPPTWEGGTEERRVNRSVDRLASAMCHSLTCELCICVHMYNVMYINC